MSLRQAAIAARNASAEAKPHRIATSVQPERFFEHYFGVVGG